MNHFKIARPLWLNTFGRTAVFVWTFVFVRVCTFVWTFVFQSSSKLFKTQTIAACYKNTDLWEHTDLCIHTHLFKCNKQL